MRFLFRVGVIIGGLYSLLHLLFRPNNTEPPVMVGHRGAAGIAPENTLAGLKAGIENRAKLVEVDVQRSSDGVLMVLHDDALDRTTTGRGLLRDHTAEALAQLDAGRFFGPSFEGERIPTLEQALLLTQELGATLVIEMKSPSEFSGIDAQLADVLKAHNAQQNVVVICFDHDWLKTFKAMMPEVRVGYLWYQRANEPAEGLPGEVVDCFWWLPILDPALVWRMNRRGYQVWVWTVDQVWAMRLLAWLGVRGITTNRPDLWPF